ncbi:spore coat protein [Acetivibrio mesophilus]|uniref:Spore coat protein n=1 Tax=Acetivibrio mesophilus TaxID=2487273 RepID=A0A4Q0I8M2_9FIRM|nr:CotH kinase family protein [Acetivibrio mesophilus]RXE60758.1 spore coat protein [Acetivibrio mesophilus]
MNEKADIKWIVKITLTILCIALLITGMALVPKAFPNTEQVDAQPDYIDKIFNKNVVNEISIEMDESDFQWLMENAMKEEYKSCNITINGETYYNVGIRPKGNSSLSQVAMSNSPQRFSFKLDFNEYIDGQTYHGANKIVLNNIISDKTYMKEYLSYELFDFMGIPSSAYAYSNIKINNEDWGLYLALEVVDESYIKRHFGSVEGNLYKPESMDMGGVRDRQQNGGPGKWGVFDNDAMPFPRGRRDQMPNGEGMQRMPNEAGIERMPNGEGMQHMPNEAGIERMPNGEGMQQIPNVGGREQIPNGEGAQGRFNGGFKGGFGGMGSRGGANLKYIDDSPSSYSVIREGAVFKTTTDAEFKKVVEMIKNLNEGANLEKYLDVDEILRFWAVNTFLVNLDGYSGGMYHNYYLYEEGGVFTLLPWDFNLSFAGFGVNDSSSAVNFPIDKPVTGSLEDAPLIGKLLEVPEYKERYHVYLKEIVEKYIDGGVYEDSINSINALISDYVKNDATAFYTFEEYQKGVQAILTFGKDRAESIRAQLNGTQPSSSYGSIETTLNLSDMGGMGGGMQPPRNMQMPNGMQMPDGMQIPNGMQIPDGMRPPDNMQPPGGMEMFRNNPASGNQSVVLILSVAALIPGLIFVATFKRRKYKT